MARVSCQWERLADLLREPSVRELLIDYWTELSPVKDRFPLDPNFGQMQTWEDAGQYKIWACRVDGSLAGFIAFQVVPHLNTKSTLWAIDCGHFIHPTFRGIGRVGFRMWKTAEAALKALGVRIIMAHDNASRPLLPFFLGLGYEPRSILYYKVID